jgi:HD-GYP domain-containing protein (c-di-GMP phosphodiesterase class II)
MNLQHPRGTLNAAEREVINNHIVHDHDACSSAALAAASARVPEYAGGHHERMDGKGYPAASSASR